MRVNVAPGPAGPPASRTGDQGTIRVQHPRAVRHLADGKRFVMLKDAEAAVVQPAGPAIVVVERWTERG